MSKVNILTRRKGQLTIFIIAGILIVIVVFFMFYAMRASSMKRLEAETRRVASVAMSQAAVEYLSEQCISRSLKDGLELLGMQGGWLREGQPGYIKELAPPADSNKISYLIYQDNYPIGWPCSASWLGPDYCRYNINVKRWFFSSSRLPSLEQVKLQLAGYIANKTRECIDLKKLLEATTANYVGNAGAIKVNEIMFNVNSVSVKLDYPIEISAGNREPVIFVQHLEGQTNNRFMLIHQILDRAIYDETQLLNYDIEKELEEAIASRFDDVKFIRVKSYGDRIYRIEDTFYDYIFQFAVRDRPPVLDYINRYPHPNDGDLYDYLAVEGENIEIIPNAVDPDGDSVIVTPQRIVLNTTAPHNETIPVAAIAGGYTDRQDARVLVDYKLRPVLDASNGYDDVDDSYASIEDEYYLDGHAMNKTLDARGAYTYSWFIGNDAFYEKKSVLNPGYFRQPGQLVNLVFKIDLHYTDYSQSASASRQIAVKECLPHETHKCCKEDFTIAKADENIVCDEKEDRYCLNKGTLFWVNATPRYCDGKSGKECSGEWGQKAEPRQTNICGVTNEGCSGSIAAKCQEWPAYLVKPGEGWCYGATGCEGFCRDSLFFDREIVDANRNSIIDSGDACGCKSQYNRYRCDSNFDGEWDGLCNGGKCE